MSEHPVYKQVDEKDAQAEAWIFKDKDTFEKCYYQLPELKEHEILMRMLSSGLCMSDSHFGRGKWGKRNYPVACGHEGIGEVIKVGSKVTKHKCGDKVMVGPFRNSCKNCDSCKKGYTNICPNIQGDNKDIYDKYWGTYNTHVHIDEDFAFKVPSNMDIKTMPPVMCAGVTTFAPLYRCAKKGDRVAVVGFGGLGHFAVQWAKKMGCTVDVFSSSHKKDELAKKLGADNVIIWTEGEHEKLSCHYEVMINTLPSKVDKKQLESLFACVNYYGKFIQVGAGDLEDDLVFHPFSFLGKHMEIIGSQVGGVKNYEDMLKFISENDGIECISEMYEWNDFDKALDKLENGKPMLRCCVNIDPVSAKYKQFIFIY